MYNEKVLIEKINKILLETWDPIGIGKDIYAQDEYTVYAYKIKNYFLKDNIKKDEIYDFLKKIEENYIGISINNIVREKTTELLINLKKDMNKKKNDNI
jgi:hypothetical protein